TAWTKILNDPANSALACLQGPGADFSGKSGPIRVLDASGTVIYDPLASPTNGFKLDGTTCSTFGTDDCPFRFNITWTAVCFARPCPNPISQLTVSGLFKAPS